MSNETMFVHHGMLFCITEEEAGKFVADIALDRTTVQPSEVENWGRVVGMFGSVGDAITAAKNEIALLEGRVI